MNVTAVNLEEKLSLETATNYGVPLSNAWKGQTLSTRVLVFGPGPSPGTVRTGEGKIVAPPADWSLLPPGDAGLTRRVKAAGEHWVVQEKKGRRTFSRGVWAPAVTIDRIRKELEAERSTDSYARRRKAEQMRREKKQEAYVDSFSDAVLAFLNFDAEHSSMAREMADAVTAHATPVGSGTVARTQRITVVKRAEAAAIAWMRHATTAYDSMKIPREKGKRREVRRMLAQRSHQLLQRYRDGEPISENCPLAQALVQHEK